MNEVEYFILCYNAEKCLDYGCSIGLLTDEECVFWATAYLDRLINENGLFEVQVNLLDDPIKSPEPFISKSDAYSCFFFIQRGGFSAPQMRYAYHRASRRFDARDNNQKSPFWLLLLMQQRADNIRESRQYGLMSTVAPFGSFIEQIHIADCTPASTDINITDLLDETQWQLLSVNDFLNPDINSDPSRPFSSRKLEVARQNGKITWLVRIKF